MLDSLFPVNFLNSLKFFILYSSNKSKNWLIGWSEIKKPTASNSFESLSSNFQSSTKDTILSSFFWSSLNKSIWFKFLLSNIFFDFKIKLGIELNKDCLLN